MRSPNFLRISKAYVHDKYENTTKMIYFFFAMLIFVD